MSRPRKAPAKVRHEIAEKIAQHRQLLSEIKRLRHVEIRKRIQERKQIWKEVQFLAAEYDLCDRSVFRIGELGG